MGFLDKLKEGAEQAKELAAAAAERAKDEAKEVNLKRQLGHEQEALGEKAYSLAEQGAISHADLEPHVTKIRELTAELEARRSEQPAGADEPTAQPPDTPPETRSQSPPSPPSDPPQTAS